MHKHKHIDPKKIVVAWAEDVGGPGWANSPVWFIWRDDNGTLRQECLQPDEHSIGISFLYEVSVSASTSMLSAVRGLMQSRVTLASRAPKS